MHIIKITPHSFKIILSKEDLMRHGVQNIFDSKELSGEFFAEIINETNSLFGNPFISGSIDAEFFEGKDGGGELFLSSGVFKKTVTYLFRTRDFESLLCLCKRLSDFLMPENSALYTEKGEYCLLLEYENAEKPVLPYLKEYGHAEKINKIQRWLLEEHAEAIMTENAALHLTGIFSS